MRWWGGARGGGEREGEGGGNGPRDLGEGIRGWRQGGRVTKDRKRNDHIASEAKRGIRTRTLGTDSYVAVAGVEAICFSSVFWLFSRSTQMSQMRSQYGVFHHCLSSEYI